MWVPVGLCGRVFLFVFCIFVGSMCSDRETLVGIPADIALSLSLSTTTHKARRSHAMFRTPAHRTACKQTILCFCSNTTCVEITLAMTLGFGTVLIDDSLTTQVRGTQAGCAMIYDNW